MLLVVVNGVKFADDLGYRIRTVLLDLDRTLFGRGLGVAEGFFGHGTAGGGIHDLLQALVSLESLEELERRQGVILVVPERIVNGTLVAVEGREVEDVIELVGHRRKGAIIRDGSLGELHAGIVGNVLLLRGKEVVYDRDPNGGISIDQHPHQIAADESGAADDQDVRVGEAVSHRSILLELEVGESLRDAVGLVPLDSALDSLRKRSGDLPAKIRVGLGRIEQNGVNVVGVAGLDFNFLVQLDAESRNRGVEKLLDGIVGAAGDMVIAALAHAVDRLHDHVHQVVDEDEVAPGVRDEAGLAGGQAGEKGREGAAEIARSIGIGEPERDEIQAGKLEILFGTGL